MSKAVTTESIGGLRSGNDHDYGCCDYQEGPKDSEAHSKSKLCTTYSEGLCTGLIIIREWVAPEAGLLLIHLLISPAITLIRITGYCYLDL